MVIVEIIGDRDVDHIPLVPVRTRGVVVGFVPAEQEDCRSPGVEREKNPELATLCCSKLFHVGLSAAGDGVHGGSPEAWSVVLQQLYPCGKCFLLFVSEFEPPIVELVCELNLP